MTLCVWLFLLNIMLGKAIQAVSVLVQYLNLLMHSLLLDMWMVSSFWQL